MSGNKSSLVGQAITSLFTDDYQTAHLQGRHTPCTTHFSGWEQTTKNLYSKNTKQKITPFYTLLREIKELQKIKGRYCHMYLDTHAFRKRGRKRKDTVKEKQKGMWCSTLIFNNLPCRFPHPRKIQSPSPLLKRMFSSNRLCLSMPFSGQWPENWILFL